MQQTRSRITIEPSGQACGATITGVDLTQPLNDATIAELRAAWLKYRVLSFPGQAMSDDDLERFTQYFGEFGEDPFFAPIEGRQNIAAIRRDAEETSPIFADNWHSDWSFMPAPPAGTCLLSIQVPPQGGDTLFADQAAAFAALPEERKEYLRSLTAIHSARRGYAADGLYGDGDQGRSMSIRAGDSAMATQTHPLIKVHPETGEEVIFSSLSYVIGIVGMEEMDALQLLMELLDWQTQDQFLYRHTWTSDMLIMWDNRSVLHRATGGYEGHDRLLHRTTIAAWDEEQASAGGAASKPAVSA